ncbi:FAD-dependent oxidoreductase [Sphingomonas sp. KRR8]|nr:FAD-dependent oxidoreductase [Sphingomonas sp. KRR8]
MGLAVGTPASAANFALPKLPGGGPHVVILGAGIAGLVSAFELEQAGYRVTLLEARDRVGGRSWTIRGRDRIVLNGRDEQRASFSPGLYFNAGPARLPSHHHAILGYARKFGVPLEPFVNANRSASWDFGGKAVRGGRMVFDLQGRIGELLTKAINRHALNDTMPAEEMKEFAEFLRFYSGLDAQGVLRPHPRSGYKVPPGGYDHPAELLDPLTLRETLPNRGVGLPHVFEQLTEMQPTMMQPVGGMDHIAHALHDALRNKARVNEPVSAIRRENAGVRIEHRSGVTRADYCICALPPPILSRIPSDFSPAKSAALKEVPMLKSAKVAFEAPRFWETDDHVYGGMAWTDRLNENILYPSSGFNSARGVLVGAYCAGWTHPDTPEAFAKLPIAEQIRISRESVEALHPGRSNQLKGAVAVDWGLVPWSEGVGAIGPDFDDAGAGVRRGPRYAELLKPEGPIIFAGEHLSYVGLWQESAATSAHEAVSLLAKMAAEKGVTAA